MFRNVRNTLFTAFVRVNGDYSSHLRLGWKAIAFSAAGFCWLAFFSCIPHKEEIFTLPYVSVWSSG
eukprot:711695-Amphidinium_carterae.1